MYQVKGCSERKSVEWHCSLTGCLRCRRAVTRGMVYSKFWKRSASFCT